MTAPRRILLTVHGPDRPGICHAIAVVLARHAVPVIDIEQASTHRLLSLAFVIDLGHLAGAGEDAALVKELLYAGWQLGAQIRLEPMKEDALYAPAELAETINRNLCAVTLIGD